MTRPTGFATAAVIVSGLVAVGSAAASTSVVGKYGCTVVMGAVSAPSDSQLALTPKGRYLLTRVGAVINGGDGGASSPSATGRYRRSGSRLRFSGGPLAGKTGVFHPRTASTSPSRARARITFSTYVAGQHDETCSK